MLRRLITLTAALLLLGCASGDPPVDTNNSDDDNLRIAEPDVRAPFGGDTGNPEDGDDASNAVDCPESSCEVGTTRCEGAGVLTCEASATDPGCGAWGGFADCGNPGEVCVDGGCIVPSQCIDNDGDGRGPQCELGSDCDDQDPSVYEGATEVCDDVDNDCDGNIDEGFDLGAPCTVGTGACEVDGTLVCGPDGGTVCSAQGTAGEPEVCDGIDNDCNGLVDDGDVCSFCQDDPNEPNDTSAEATLVQVDDPKIGYLCPGDTDWFELEVQSDQDYRIYVVAPSARAVTINGYVDGTLAVSGDNTDDEEMFYVYGDAGTRFEIEVINQSGEEAFFYVSLVNDAAHCGNEDGFVPNQEISQARSFPSNWLTTAHLCPDAPDAMSDWYFMGDLDQGDSLEIGAQTVSQFGTDLDLYLWGDEDGDTVFEIIAESAGASNSEFISFTAPYTGPYYFEVRDYEGLGGDYEIFWTVN